MYWIQPVWLYWQSIYLLPYMAICSLGPVLKVSLLHSDLIFKGHFSRVPSRVPPSHPGYIFENLPGGGSLGIFYDLVRVFLSIQLILTYPIAFKPATEVVEKIWYNILMVSLPPSPSPSPPLSSVHVSTNVTVQVLSKNKYGKLSFVKNLYYNNVSVLCAHEYSTAQSVPSLCSL